MSCMYTLIKFLLSVNREHFICLSETLIYSSPQLTTVIQSFAILVTSEVMLLNSWSLIVSEWIEFISNQADLQQRCHAAEGEVTRLRMQVNQYKSDKEASDLRVKHIRWAWFILTEILIIKCNESNISFNLIFAKKLASSQTIKFLISSFIVTESSLQKKSLKDKH